MIPFTCAPYCENSIPLGVLNAGDALQVLLQDVQDEEAMLRDYVMGVGYR